MELAGGNVSHSGTRARIHQTTTAVGSSLPRLSGQTSKVSGIWLMTLEGAVQGCRKLDFEAELQSSLRVTTSTCTTYYIAGANTFPKLERNKGMRFCPRLMDFLRTLLRRRRICKCDQK